MWGETKKIKRLKVKIFDPLDNTRDKRRKKRPVLCFLHGSDEHNGNLTLTHALRRHGPLKNDKKTGEGLNDRFLVIFPQLPAPGGDVWQRFAKDIEEIVKVVWDGYGGDRKRTYLTGFSYGGNGVFRLAVLQPALWTAVWPVDPVMTPPKGLPMPVLVTMGEYARRHETMLIKQGYKKIESNGFRSNTLYIDYEKDHVRTATAAYRDKRIYDWLLRKKKS